MNYNNITYRVKAFSICLVFLMGILVGCAEEPNKSSLVESSALLSSTVADISSTSAQSTISETQTGGDSSMNTSVTSETTKSKSMISTHSETPSPTSTPSKTPSPTSGSSGSVFEQNLASEKKTLDKIAASQPGFHVTDSLDSTGDYTRITNVMRKANRGEQITVGILGDSISYGAGASSLSKSFASVVKYWWIDVFGYENIEFVNASIGSNSLTNIVHRMDDDLLSSNPDIVIFGPWTFHNAINDSIAMESIIKRMLDRNIAVLCVILTDSNGGNNHDKLAPIAQYYKVPVVSFANAYVNSNLFWDDIGSDYIHPNDLGHSLISLCINTLFTNTGYALESYGTSPASLPSSAYQQNGWRYVNATLWDRNDSEKITVTERGSFVDSERKMTDFRTYKGWKSTTSSTLVCELEEISSLHLMYHRIDGGGTAYVTVTTQGGESVCKDKVIDTYASSTTGFSWNSDLLATDINEPVTVSIRTEDGEVFVLGFAVT